MALTELQQYVNQEISNLNIDPRLLSAAEGPISGMFERIRNGNFPPGAEAGTAGLLSKASFSTSDLNNDWRVRISFPYIDSYMQSPVLKPLLATDGLVFPFTPVVNITHSATYNSLDPIHNNYPFLAYQNSKIDQIQITGDFVVETSTQAQYWVAAVHFLRSLTKMLYGETSYSGSPPPVVKLSGYGAHVFSNTPIVIANFTVSLPNDVDYMSCKIGGMIDRVPVKSTFVVQANVVYSREQVRQFSLDSFVKGELVGRFV